MRLLLVLFIFFIFAGCCFWDASYRMRIILNQIPKIEI